MKLQTMCRATAHWIRVSPSSINSMRVALRWPALTCGWSS